MTRTDIDAKSMRRGPSRRCVSLRMLLVLPVALLLLAAPAAPALAATSTNKEGLSGYTHTEPAKQETQPAKQETQPSTSKTSPQKESEPSTTSTTPATPTVPTKTQAPAKAGTLPFTGLDLRWTVGFGLLLIVAGGSIVMVQRSQRRGSSR